MEDAKKRAKLEEAYEAITQAGRKLTASHRECSGGICIWHRYAPEEMTGIGCHLIDARYAVGELLRDHGVNVLA